MTIADLDAATLLKNAVLHSIGTQKTVQSLQTLRDLFPAYRPTPDFAVRSGRETN